MSGRRGGVAALLLGCALLCGCESIGYYGQAISGHLTIMMNRQPLERVIENGEVDAEVAERLQLIGEIRQYAQEQLGLPVGDNYATFVSTGRRYVVWNLFATPELSLEPLEWCFPVVGCVTYRGYFREERARKYAARLRQSGHDVYVGGVAAYSTLGWFSDPVLDTFLRRSDRALAALIFHEVAHTVCYLPGDTRFNEGFATTVEIEGVRRWLQDRGDEGAHLEYLAERERRTEFAGLVARYRVLLRSVYEGAATPDEKRASKRALIERLRADYADLRESWGHHDDYDSWVAGEINNAKLISIGSYNDLVPAFQRLLAERGADLGRFGSGCRELADSAGDERERELERLSAAR